MPIEHGNADAERRFKALYAKLGAELKAAREDDDRVRALLTDAVAQYMQIARDAGAGPAEEPAELGCAEELQGEPFEIADTTDEEYSKWSDMLADAAGY